MNNLVSDILVQFLVKDPTVATLYKSLDLDSFCKLIAIIDGKEVEFPTKDSFMESLMLARCYYYRTFLKCSWEEVKDKLGSPDLNVKKVSRQLYFFEQKLKNPKS